MEKKRECRCRFSNSLNMDDCLCITDRAFFYPSFWRIWRLSVCTQILNDKLYLRVIFFLFSVSALAFWENFNSILTIIIFCMMKFLDSSYWKTQRLPVHRTGSNILYVGKYVQLYVPKNRTIGRWLQMIISTKIWRPRPLPTPSQIM